MFEEYQRTTKEDMKMASFLEEDGDEEEDILLKDLGNLVVEEDEEEGLSFGLRKKLSFELQWKLGNFCLLLF